MDVKLYLFDCDPCVCVIFLSLFRNCLLTRLIAREKTEGESGAKDLATSVVKRCIKGISVWCNGKSSFRWWL